MVGLSLPKLLQEHSQVPLKSLVTVNVQTQTSQLVPISGFDIKADPLNCGQCYFNVSVPSMVTHFQGQTLTPVLQSAQLENVPMAPALSILVQTLGRAIPSAHVKRVAPASVPALLMEQDFVSMDKHLVMAFPAVETVQIVDWAVCAWWGLVVTGMFASQLTFVAERVLQNC
jgi:hypothetical protein